MLAVPSFPSSNDLAAAAELPVTLTDELSHADDLPLSRDCYENNGFLVLARAGGQDLMLWTSSNIIRGTGAGQWVTPDGRVHSTNLILVPQDRRGTGMFDNDFIRSGWHLPLYDGPQALQVTQEADRVLWAYGDRLTVCRPPVWEVHGTHAGVELDLTFQKLAPAIWLWGPFAQAPRNDQGGYELFTRAEGTIRVGGQVYTIENGMGVHEHALLGQSWDVVPDLTRGAEFNWMPIATDDIQIFLLRHTGRGIDLGQVHVDGQDILFLPSRGLGTISFHTQDRWYDPRTGLYLPSRWHIEMRSPQGRLELHIRAHARSYYQYTVKKGVVILVWLMSVANGSFHFPDGRVVKLEDTLLAMEWGQAILSAVETLEGPGR